MHGLFEFLFHFGIYNMKNLLLSRFASTWKLWGAILVPLILLPLLLIEGDEIPPGDGDEEHGKKDVVR